MNRRNELTAASILAKCKVPEETDSSTCFKGTVFCLRPQNSKKRKTNPHPLALFSAPNRHSDLGTEKFPSIHRDQEECLET